MIRLFLEVVKELKLGTAFGIH